MKHRDLLLAFCDYVSIGRYVAFHEMIPGAAEQAVDNFLSSRGVPSSLPNDTTAPQHLHPEPKEWFEVEMDGDPGPFPKLFTLRDAEACGWLLLEKHEAVYRVVRVDRLGRTLVCLVPPGLAEAS
jgi:hypothetical protein